MLRSQSGLGSFLDVGLSKVFCLPLSTLSRSDGLKELLLVLHVICCLYAANICRKRMWTNP